MLITIFEHVCSVTFLCILPLNNQVFKQHRQHMQIHAHCILHAQHVLNMTKLHDGFSNNLVKTLQTIGKYKEENLSDPIMQCTARQCEADDGVEPQPLKTTEPKANTQRPPTTDQPNRLACYSRFHKSHETTYILWTERETETGGGKCFKVAYSLKALLTCLSWNPIWCRLLLLLVTWTRKQNSVSWECAILWFST